MDVVQSMCGKYTMCADQTEGLDEYAAAMKFPAELTQKLREERNMTSDINVEGDVINIHTKYSVGGEELSFKLGETFTSNMGVDVENVFVVEDGELRGTHVIGGKVTCFSRRYLKDGVLRVISVAEDGKTTMTVMLKTC